MKKKTVSILLTAAMALSLAACGSSNSTDSSSKSSSKAESTSASSASSEAESASSAKSTADGEVFDDTTVTVFAAKSLSDDTNRRGCILRRVLLRSSKTD